MFLYMRMDIYICPHIYREIYSKQILSFSFFGFPSLRGCPLSVQLLQIIPFLMYSFAPFAIDLYISMNELLTKQDEHLIY